MKQECIPEGLYRPLVEHIPKCSMEGGSAQHPWDADPLDITLSQTLLIFWKFQFDWMGLLVSYCQPFWMAAITKNHKNDYHGSTLQHKDLQQK